MCSRHQCKISLIPPNRLEDFQKLNKSCFSHQLQIKDIDVDSILLHKWEQEKYILSQIHEETKYYHYVIIEL